MNDSVFNINNIEIPLFGGKEVTLSTAYLAPISYYKILSESELTYIEKKESYIKQTYRNRCKIATANGIMTLNIPIESNGGRKINIKDVRISEHDNWQINHWRSIKSAYSSSPFFEYYQDDFRPFYEKKWKFLWDFNLELLEKTLELIDIQSRIEFTEEYQPKIENDFKDKIHPKKESVIDCPQYYQVFQEKYGFQPDLSIIDLLFNMGNETILTLKKSKILNI